eukprot:scaffold204662_cov18-Tisochrysis_lutea.AAC.1
MQTQTWLILGHQPGSPEGLLEATEVLGGRLPPEYGSKFVCKLCMGMNSTYRLQARRKPMSDNMCQSCIVW